MITTSIDGPCHNRPCHNRDYLEWSYYRAFHVKRIWRGSADLEGYAFHVKRAAGDVRSFHVKQVDRSDRMFHVKQIM